MIQNSSKGFTLVELAVALMVIGLLIGGILKGQELLENARLTKFMRQIKSYDAAAMIFRDTYGELPGDTKTPARIPDCTADACMIGGNGDNRVRTSTGLTPNTIELGNFFVHMTKAGTLGSGPLGGTVSELATYDTDNADLFLPVTPFDPYVQIIYLDRSQLSSEYQPGHYYFIHVTNIAPKILSNIDSKFDDNKPLMGNVFVRNEGTCPVTGTDPLAAIYNQTLTADTIDCNLYIGARF